MAPRICGTNARRSNMTGSAGAGTPGHVHERRAHIGFAAKGFAERSGPLGTVSKASRGHLWDGNERTRDEQEQQREARHRWHGVIVCGRTCARKSGIAVLRTVRVWERERGLSPRGVDRVMRDCCVALALGR